jgi:vacuolar protein sorting-associated protein 11
LASAPEIFKVCNWPIVQLLYSPSYLQKTPEISCITSTAHGTLVADIHGSVYQLNEDFETTKAWIAHSNGRVTHMLERNSLLVTLGVSLLLLLLFKL